MDGPSAHRGHDEVASLLYVQSSFDGRPVELGELDRVGTAEEVRSMQQIDVKSVALDPLPAVEQSSEPADRFIHDYPARIFHRRAGTHLICDRTDPADARSYIGASVK